MRCTHRNNNPKRAGGACPSCHVSEWRRRTKRKAVVYKGGECVNCGFSAFNSALHFHHLDASIKDFSISDSGTCRSWDRVMKELDKCMLVCSNCHAGIHSGDILGVEDTGPSPEDGRVLVLELYPHKKVNERKCVDCSAEISARATRCTKCHSVSTEKISWPNTEDLRIMVEESSLSAVGRVFEVSGNAVKKRLAKH